MRFWNKAITACMRVLISKEFGTLLQKGMSCGGITQCEYSARLNTGYINVNKTDQNRASHNQNMSSSRILYIVMRTIYINWPKTKLLYWQNVLFMQILSLHQNTPSVLPLYNTGGVETANAWLSRDETWNEKMMQTLIWSASGLMEAVHTLAGKWQLHCYFPVINNVIAPFTFSVATILFLWASYSEQLCSYRAEVPISVHKSDATERQTLVSIKSASISYEDGDFYLWEN